MGSYDTGQGKKVQATVYLPEEELAEYREAAKREGIKFAEYARRALKAQHRRRPIFRKAEYQALARIREQIRMVGLNVNQITRRLHTWLEDPRAKKQPDAEALNDMAAYLISQRKNLDDILAKFKP